MRAALLRQGSSKTNFQYQKCGEIDVKLRQSPRLRPIDLSHDLQFSSVQSLSLFSHARRMFAQPTLAGSSDTFGDFKDKVEVEVNARVEKSVPQCPCHCHALSRSLCSPFLPLDLTDVLRA